MENPLEGIYKKIRSKTKNNSPNQDWVKTISSSEKNNQRKPNVKKPPAQEKPAPKQMTDFKVISKQQQQLDYAIRHTEKLIDQIVHQNETLEILINSKREILKDLENKPVRWYSVFRTNLIQSKVDEIFELREKLEQLKIDKKALMDRLMLYQQQFNLISRSIRFKNAFLSLREVGRTAYDPLNPVDGKPLNPKIFQLLEEMYQIDIPETLIHNGEFLTDVRHLYRRLKSLNHRDKKLQNMAIAAEQEFLKKWFGQSALELFEWTCTHLKESAQK